MLKEWFMFSRCCGEEVYQANALYSCVDSDFYICSRCDKDCNTILVTEKDSLKCQTSKKPLTTYSQMKVD